MALVIVAYLGPDEGRCSPGRAAVGVGDRRALLAMAPRADGSALSRREPAADATARRAKGRWGDGDRHAARLPRRADRANPRGAGRGGARSTAVRAEQLVRLERPGDPRGGRAPRPPSARLSPLLYPRRGDLDRPRRGRGPRAGGQAARDAARDLRGKGAV